MAERRTRRRFTAGFKAQAVERVLGDGKGLTEVATEPGVSTGQPSTWRTERSAVGSAEAPAARKAEMQRLKREVRRLEEENPILREAAAFSPRESRDHEVRLRVANKGEHAVATLCRVAGCGVSGFYAWLRAIPAVQRRAEAGAGMPFAGADFRPRPWPRRLRQGYAQQPRAVRIVDPVGPTHGDNGVVARRGVPLLRRIQAGFHPPGYAASLTRLSPGFGHSPPAGTFDAP